MQVLENNAIKGGQSSMITNAAVIGYALLAAKEMGSSKAELDLLESIMRSVLDEIYRRRGGGILPSELTD